eukprot:14907789-Alexandrium_andersonii.AAC.1
MGQARCRGRAGANVRAPWAGAPSARLVRCSLTRASGPQERHVVVAQSWVVPQWLAHSARTSA